jgi:oligosaccharide repeat unit polymerase
LEYNSAYEPTLELANSVRTLFQSLTEVPAKHDFFYGKLWLSDIMSPIPFMQSAYLELSNDNIYELSSTGYTTYLVYGNDSTSGEGTTLIADIYLNFGLPGIVILMFLFGLLIKKANIELLVHNNYHWIIIAAILASFSIYFGRSSYLIILRPIVWSYFIVFLFVKKYRIKI